MARILLCDDNHDFVSTFALLFESEGHDVTVCYTGRGCISKAGERMPEIAFIDIGLPDCAGYEVAGAIRRLPAGRKARLIAVTGYAEFDDVQRAKAAGFDLHLKKGTDPQVFVNLAARAKTRAE